MTRDLLIDGSWIRVYSAVVTVTVSGYLLQSEPMASETNNHGKRATIRGVASAAGVSIATVSRVLNGRPDVAPETREVVLRAVREQGFSTNRNARALSGGRTGLIGVTLPMVEAAYFGAILSGTSEALYEQDMRIVLCPTLHQHEREVTLLDRLVRGTTDGAVLMLPEESSAELNALQEQGFPFVVVDPRVALDEGIPVVSAAHAAGARAATEHLLELGHRRIGVITGPRDWLASTERLNGYHGALGAAGILPDPALVAVSDFRTGRSREAAAGAMLDLPDPPTAIFAFNDNAAVSVLHAARAARPPPPGGPLRRRLRRLRAGGDRDAAADHRAAAARRARPHGRERPPARARGPTPRRRPDPARDEARRARVDRAAAAVVALSNKLPRMTLLADVVTASKQVTDTSSRSRKVAILAELLGRLDANEVAVAAGFLSGVPRQGRVGVGYSTIYGIECAPAARGRR